MIFYKNIFYKLFDCFQVLKKVPNDLFFAFEIDKIKEFNKIKYINYYKSKYFNYILLKYYNNDLKIIKMDN